MKMMSDGGISQAMNVYQTVQAFLIYQSPHLKALMYSARLVVVFVLQEKSI